MKKAYQDLHSSLPVLHAAFHHKSALSKAQEILNSTNLSKDILPMWEEFGKYVIHLYAARRVIDVIGCENTGSATLMHRNISIMITESLIYHLKPDFIFGDGITEKEKLSPNVLRSLVYQIIGALAHLKGYLEAVSVYLTEDFIPKFFEISTAKDPKTIVQELFQSRRWGKPQYKELERSGKDHDLIFKAGLSDVYGNSSVGNGRSKKDAEKDAAKKYLVEFHPKVRLNKIEKITLHPDISKRTPNKKVNLQNSKKVEELIAEIGLPVWTSYILSLSQTHRSYEGCEFGPFGRDNALLAFFGSYVVAWGIRDHVLKTVNIDSIRDSGGLGETALYTLSKAGLTASCNWLDNRNLQCVGKAMTGSGTGALQSMQEEMTQAFMAVLFLGQQEKVKHFMDVCRSVKGLHNYLDGINDRIVPKFIRSYKTSLQEKCQAIGVHIRYATISSNQGDNTSIRPKIIIESLCLDRTLTIQGQTSVARKHEVLSHTHHEQKLAALVCEIFDKVQGFKENLEDLQGGLISIQKFLLEHSISAASQAAIDITSRKTKIFLSSEPLGLQYLRKEELNEFKQWIRNSAKSINIIEHRSSLLFLYELSGQRTEHSALNKELHRGLAEITTALETIDPLEAPILTQNDARFQAIVDIASWLKISGGATQYLRTRELSDQCKLLYKGKVLISDDDSLIYEIKGAHLAIIQLILDAHKKLDYTQSSLVFSVEHGHIHFRSEATHAKIMKELYGRPLWNGLRGLIGKIDEIQSETYNFHIRLTQVNMDELDSFAMEAWWTHKCGGALNAAANDVAATILHDMKNELLGYFSASDQARNSFKNSDKYRLAAMASNHLDTAITQAGTIHVLLKNSLSPKKSQVDLASFLRRLNGEVLSWLPVNVKISFFRDEEVNLILTDDSLLRSLLNNTIRNACEAFGKFSGTIAIDCRMTTSCCMRINIEDNGPGFSDEQLANLNRGTPIASSKRHGPGIGLLTVLLLARELGGTVTFDRTESGGACVSVSLPIAEENEIEVVRTYDLSNMENQEVNV